MLTIAGSKKVLDKVVGLMHAIQPREEAAGVLPCFTFGGSEVDIAGNKVWKRDAIIIGQ